MSQQFYRKLIILFAAFACGASVGSFLNACFYRLPRGLPVGNDRSRCPACQTQIPWYDNVPCLSYFILKGSCRYCKTAIPARYLWAEVICGLAGVTVAAAILYPMGG